jgi:hypothetical protein
MSLLQSPPARFVGPRSSQDDSTAWFTDDEHEVVSSPNGYGLSKRAYLNDNSTLIALMIFVLAVIGWVLWAEA